MKNLVAKYILSRDGELVHFNEESHLVLWKDNVKNEYIVSKIIILENNSFSLIDGSYFDNIEDSMLSYLSRKGKRLSISIGISESDSEDIREGEIFDWTYSDKSGICVDVKIMDDYIWNSEEANV